MFTVKNISRIIQRTALVILSCCLTIHASLIDRVSNSVDTFLTEQSNWIQKGTILFSEVTPYLLQWRMEQFRPHDILTIISSTLLKSATPFIEKASVMHPLAEKAFAFAYAGSNVKEAYRYIQNGDIDAFFEKNRSIDQQHQNIEN